MGSNICISTYIIIITLEGGKSVIAIKADYNC
jgi:hypothetical protein